ncbi:MAG: 3-methyl-2-oxobutanoate dehydrogenase subunit VorB [Acholeplasmataceae bacterium]
MSKVLMKGNEAIAEAVIRAGCDAFFGYPITPQNEVPEYLSKHLVDAGKAFVQAESEVAAINMVYGAAGAGARVMTSSSSVGIALMQEGISYIAGSELPCLIVSVMRGGPGLGNIAPAQSDYYQSTRGGGNGDYHVIVIAPESIQEAVDYIKEGFEIAEIYRNPVMILVDGLIGQMMESIDLDRPYPKREIPEKTYASNGTDYHEGRNIINSVYLDPPVLEEHNRKLQKKYQQITEKEIKVETVDLDEAEYVIVAYGTSARIARSSMQMLSEQGIRVGMIRPITLWPFPYRIFDRIPETCKGIMVFEMSAGQMVDDVLIANRGRFNVSLYGRPGGVVPEPEELVDAVTSFEDWAVKR